jgi:hypothetical protein
MISRGLVFEASGPQFLVFACTSCERNGICVVAKPLRTLLSPVGFRSKYPQMRLFQELQIACIARHPLGTRFVGMFQKLLNACFRSLVAL